ncbi:MAG: chromate transporter [Anaerovoracaceae bacterium]
MMITQLFLLFFRIGLFSFGGGYAMLPLIYQGANELTGMTAEEFSRLVALSQVTPGPVAINAATYVGYQSAGIPGATVATLGVVLPSVLLVFIVSLFLVKFKESEAMKAVLSGIRPATVGLLLSAVIFLAQGSILTGVQLNLLPVVFFVVVLFISGKFHADPILVTVVAGVAGALVIR